MPASSQRLAEPVRRVRRSRPTVARSLARDLFVHHSGINSDGYRTLPKGSRVSYEEEQGDKGPKAVDVTRL
jgi:cold shock CspA family protein